MSAARASLTGELRSIIDRHESEGSFWGACLVTAGGETFLAEARGYAHRGFRVPNAIDTLFDTASVTKIFTAAAAFRLVDRGILGLDESVRDIIDLGDSPIPRAATIRHCLTHSSGIADDADEEAGEDYEEIWRRKPCYSVRETRDFLPQFARKPPVFEPGCGCRYNNCAFVLAGLAMEARLGVPYRRIVEAEVFRPAGMAGAAFIAKDGLEAAAEGYADSPGGEGMPEGLRKNIYSFPPIGSPDAGAYVAVGDLRAFFAALEGESFLSPASRRELLSARIPYAELKSGGTRKMGYALEFDYDRDGRLLRFGKDGVNPGVAAIAMRYPAADGFVAILSNRDSDVWSLCRELAAAAGFVPPAGEAAERADAGQ